ncbi:MAG: hypothetical protein LQ351_004307 [Letrouitia transgressa]|nr:MAG: hypothetical protein LQ351_004307 [Letrouitia transgressa]
MPPSTPADNIPSFSNCLSPAFSGALVTHVTDFVRSFMSQPHFDASHNFAHIQRVLTLAEVILEAEQKLNRNDTFDRLTVKLAALLHDVSDRKYAFSTTSVTEIPLAQQKLLEFGCPDDMALRVQAIIDSVSYSAERQFPEKVADTLHRHPELAIVQDADRLDALGAVGVGRTFTYNAAANRRSGMEQALAHFDEKLLQLEALMKTKEGRRLAKGRTERLKVFKEWWEEEINEEKNMLERAKQE